MDIKSVAALVAKNVAWLDVRGKAPNRDASLKIDEKQLSLAIVVLNVDAAISCIVISILTPY